jgi:hypothetical protein
MFLSVFIFGKEANDRGNDLRGLDGHDLHSKSPFGFLLKGYANGTKTVSRTGVEPSWF